MRPVDLVIGNRRKRSRISVKPRCKPKRPEHIATGATDKSCGAALQDWEVGQPHLPCPRLHAKSTHPVALSARFEFVGAVAVRQAAQRLQSRACRSLMQRKAGKVPE